MQWNRPATTSDLIAIVIVAALATMTFVSVGYLVLRLFR